MARKKWTAQTEITDSLIRLRDKRKWQIALRRYVLEKKWSAAYAPYFGIDINHFRQWVSLQFAGEAHWENFGTLWQFDHIVPLAYFDFDRESDLRLCWNFTNIRIEHSIKKEFKGIDVLGARRYFETLYSNTGYHICGEMLSKLTEIEAAQVRESGPQEHFLAENADYLATISGFSSYEFEQLNEGVPMKIILDGQAFSARVQAEDGNNFD